MYQIGDVVRYTNFMDEVRVGAITKFFGEKIAVIDAVTLVDVVDLELIKKGV